MDTTGLGVEGAPDPVASRTCGTRKTRQGPGAVGAAGKPEVTKAQFPGGNRMLKKRKPVAERRQEIQVASPVPPGRRPGITGRISRLVRERESALT